MTSRIHSIMGTDVGWTFLWIAAGLFLLGTFVKAIMNLFFPPNFQNVITLADFNSAGLIIV